jgi:hypothetical protein
MTDYRKLWIDRLYTSYYNVSKIKRNYIKTSNISDYFSEFINLGYIVYRENDNIIGTDNTKIYIELYCTPKFNELITIYEFSFFYTRFTIYTLDIELKRALLNLDGYKNILDIRKMLDRTTLYIIISTSQISELIKVIQKHRPIPDMKREMCRTINDSLLQENLVNYDKNVSAIITDYAIKDRIV